MHHGGIGAMLPLTMCPNVDNKVCLCLDESQHVLVYPRAPGTDLEDFNLLL